MSLIRLPVGKQRFLPDRPVRILDLTIYTPYSSIHKQVYSYQEALESLRDLREQGIMWDSYEISKR